MSLEDQIAQAFAEGVEEITIRVGRYAPDCTTPVAFQAIVKHRTRMTGPWGVGVMASPVAALRRALEDGKPAAAADDGSVFD